MIKPGKYTSTVLFGLSIFLMLDASLAFVVGERYMYWGLEYMPVWYRTFIINIYESPRPVLWMVMSLEFMVGSGLFLMARKLIKREEKYNESFDRKV